ncbi:hypothetical protein GCM10009096_22120 [Parasphingorhabdus litoris]|uniref:Beta-lactamase-related domain-containing protein n=1 Tax=Parasphingorhabdus litoris TaxID=394733 RepID=A0ABN1ALY4_9SPHN|nr:serine hydrolase domain-containing protein [Parasphingorhabdus litoris]
MTIVMGRRQLCKFGMAAAVLPVLPACVTRYSESRTPTEGQVNFIEAKMAEHRIPGAGLAFVEEGKLAWERGFGVKNSETGDPVSTQTLFQAASLSKPLFAYVVMQAIDREEIGLDDRLTKFVRPTDLKPHHWSEQITVRDVLQHTTGLPNWRDDKDGPEPLVPAFEPGTGSTYSGEAYHWLQRVMEKITGLGLDAMIRERLFVPAGLEDMRMLWEPERDSREVYGHIVNDQDALVVDNLQFIREQGPRLVEVAKRWGRPMRMWTAEDHEKAVAEMRPHEHARLKDRPAWRWGRPGAFIIDSASSLRCTAGDYARFLCLMMPGRDRADWELTEQKRQAMLTPQFEQDIEGGRLPRTFGWGLEKRQNGVAYYHWGKNGRSHISVALGDPVTQKGIVVMTNGPNGNAFIKDVVTSLMDKNYIGITS